MTTLFRKGKYIKLLQEFKKPIRNVRLPAHNILKLPGNQIVVPNIKLVHGSINWHLLAEHFLTKFLTNLKFQNFVT